MIKGDSMNDYNDFQFQYPFIFHSHKLKNWITLRQFCIILNYETSYVVVVN